MLCAISTSAMAENTKLGTNAGAALTSGDENTLIGVDAGAALTTQGQSTFVGQSAGAANTTGQFNSFFGYQAGMANTIGHHNSFFGYQAGKSNINGASNTAIGYQAGTASTTGFGGTYIGSRAGYAITTENKNTFIGEEAGYQHTGGQGNTSIGYGSMYDAQGGNYNTAMGTGAGYSLGKPNSIAGELYNGSRNTVIGTAAGGDIGGGNANTMIGDNAGPNTESADFNTFVGFQAGFDNNRTNSITNANRNTALGAYAGYTNREGEDNIWIGTLADSADWTFYHDNEVEFVSTHGSDWYVTYNDLDGTARANNSTNVSRTTVLGNQATVIANDGVAVGYSSRIAQVGSIAIGTNATNANTNSIVLGYNGTSHSDNAVLLGNSTTTLWSAQTDATTTLGNASYRFTDVFSNKVSVNAATGNGAQIDLFADAGAADDDKWTITAANGGDFAISSFSTGSDVNLLSIDNTGNATIAGNLSLNSDRRLKTDIQSINGALETIDKLDGKRYHWKPELQKGNEQQVGLIAQEVEAVLPELVSENDKGIKSVNYVALVPVLINAVKEQQAQIAAQQKQIEALMRLVQK